MKYLSLFFALFVSFTVLSSKTVLAQTPAKSQRWVCLDATGTGNGHQASLTVKDDPAYKLIENSTTYVVECASAVSGAGSGCTSGNASIDGKFGLNTPGFNYIYEGGSPNPTMSDGDGNLTPQPYIWGSAGENANRKWLAVNEFDPIPTGNCGQAGTQKQCTATLTLSSAVTNCTGLSWDPYGRVFDSQSLEPIKGATVRLLDEALKQFVDPQGIKRFDPVTTDMLGGYKFVPPEGLMYALSVENLPTHSFPFNPVKLSPNYKYAYSDLYYGTGHTEQVFQEIGLIHRDIPVDPKGVPYTRNLERSGFDPIMDRATGSHVIDGIVSHPLTKINVYSKILDPLNSGKYIRGKLLKLKPANADKNGSYKIIVPPLDSGICCEIEFIKTDLRTYNPVSSRNNLFQRIIGLLKNIISIPQVEAATNTLIYDIDPIPTYLEGYVYDTNGQLLPNATVSVYLTISKKPYYQTQADEKGYFVMGSDKLPPMAYYLVYSTAGGVSVKATTSQFISQNNTFITEKKVNLFPTAQVSLQTNTNGQNEATSPIFSGGKTGASGQTNPAGTNQTNGGQTTGKNGTTSNTPSETATQSPPQQKQVALIILILLFLIMVVGGMIGFYVWKKKQGLQQPLV